MTLGFFLPPLDSDLDGSFSSSFSFFSSGALGQSLTRRLQASMSRLSKGLDFSIRFMACSMNPADRSGFSVLALAIPQ